MMKYKSKVKIKRYNAHVTEGTNATTKIVTGHLIELLFICASNQISVTRALSTQIEMRFHVANNHGLIRVSALRLLLLIVWWQINSTKGEAAALLSRCLRHSGVLVIKG